MENAVTPSGATPHHTKVISKIVDIYLEQSSLQEVRLQEVRLIANLTGVITKRWPEGRHTLFLQLHDASATIHLRHHKHRPSEPGTLSNQLAQIRVNDHVSVRGLIGYTSRGVLCVDIETVTILLRPPVDAFMSVRPALSRRLAVQHILAQARSKAHALLTELGFDEFEPMFLSSSPPAPERATLRVTFPGRGSQGYLVPSPARQLIDAVFNTASSRVFSISHNFLPAPHDAYTGFEGLVISACQLGVSLEELPRLAEHVLKAALSGYMAASNQTADWCQRQWQVKSISAGEQNEVSSPEVQVNALINQEAQIAPRDVVAFRVVWPPNLTIAEGHTELLDEQTRLGGLTIHLQLATMYLYEAIMSSI